jgi:hypothetical protein
VLPDRIVDDEIHKGIPCFFYVHGPGSVFGRITDKSDCTGMDPEFGRVGRFDDDPNLSVDALDGSCRIGRKDKAEQGQGCEDNTDRFHGVSSIKRVGVSMKPVCESACFGVRWYAG